VGPVLVVAAILVFSAPLALAARGPVAFFGGTGTTGGKFPNTLGGIDINQAGTGGASAGDVYVADREGRRIQQFTASGEFIRAFGLDVGGAGVDVCTTASQCGIGAGSGAAGSLAAPAGLAIEQSTGNLYVADRANHRVDVFSAVGAFEGAFGWKVDASAPAEELQFCDALSGCQAGSAGSGAGQLAATGGEGEGLSVAVSPTTGDVIVGDGLNRRVSEFSPNLSGGTVTGTAFLRGYGWGARDGSSEFQICTTSCHAPAPLEAGAAPGQFGEDGPYGVWVDASGRVYATEQSRVSRFGVPSGANRIQMFSATGAALGDFPAAIPLRPYIGIAIDRSTGVLAVADQSNGGVDEFESSGALRSELLTGSGLWHAPGLAFDEASGDLYIANQESLAPFQPGETRGVFMIGETTPPDATIEPPTEVAGTSAKLHGAVDPEGFFTGYRFEYSVAGSGEWTSTASKNLPPDSEPHAVEESVSGLEALTGYQVRLVAEKAFGGGTAEDEDTFATPVAPPVVSAVSPTRITDTTATLAGTVNPENQATAYEFQYVTEQQFVEHGFENATVAARGELPAGGASVPVTTPLGGLTPRTTYIVRLKAANATPPQTEGAEVAFTTYIPGSTGLPDSRAYEQVSPVDKDGANIQSYAYAFHAAEAGDAMTIFNPAGLPAAPGSGGQQFPIYISARGATNWETRGTLPPSSLGRVGHLVGWSEDDARTYAVAGEEAGAESLYRRDVATGQDTLIAKEVEATSAGLGKTNIADESADGNVVVFESYAQLFPKARKNKPNVYAWDAASGQLTLVSVLPNGSTPVSGAFAGPYDWVGPTEYGGPFRAYYTREQNVVSGDGNLVFFTDALTDQIYVRNLAQGRTTEVSASQKTNGSGSGGADPLGPKPAAFLGATPDGAKAFFLSSEKLTDDATTGPGDEGRDLYRYDLGTETLVDLVPDGAEPSGAKVQAFLGTSDNGSVVYFLADGVLAAGASPGTCNAGQGPGVPSAGECNVYVWNGGNIEFIARVEVSGTSEGMSLNWLPTAAAGLSTQVQVPRTATVTPDGRNLLFTSEQPLTSYDSAGHTEIYRYTLGGASLCVSCNPTGAAATSDASLTDLNYGFVKSPTPEAASRLRNVSPDGGRIVFQTEEQLVADDTNAVSDVYEWEANGAGSCHSEEQNGGCLFLISTGTSSQPSYLADSDKGLNNVFFLTAQPLVPQDKDEFIDMYDARVDGGLPAQTAPEPEPCGSAETCAGDASVAATLPAVDTRAAGSGNVKPGPHCKKGSKRVKRHGKQRCIRLKKHRHSKRHRHGGKHGHGTTSSSNARGKRYGGGK
jgi:hypothetical protein